LGKKNPSKEIQREWHHRLEENTKAAAAGDISASRHASAKGDVLSAAIRFIDTRFYLNAITTFVAMTFKYFIAHRKILSWEDVDLQAEWDPASL
jgi:hypothetical protein